jgi:hypothetical protein
MSRIKGYSVTSPIGRFEDEAAFKKKFMSIIASQQEDYKAVLAIENAVEPGMPDLLLIDIKDKSKFVELKYARGGVITFKKSQIPWYRRHKNLNIVVIAYNDKTKNIHTIDAKAILSDVNSVHFKLRDEKELI